MDCVVGTNWIFKKMVTLFLENDCLEMGPELPQPLLKWGCLTVWKIHNFFIPQILREIIFEDFRSAQSTISTHLGSLNLQSSEHLKLHKKGSF